MKREEPTDREDGDKLELHRLQWEEGRRHSWRGCSSRGLRPGRDKLIL